MGMHREKVKVEEKRERMPIEMGDRQGRCQMKETNVEMRKWQVRLEEGK